METIKYEIPEGYECTKVEKDIKENVIVIKHTLNKTRKDFHVYALEYSNSIDLFKKPFDYLYASTNGIDYKKVPFEYKIGLLRFICNDLWKEYNYIGSFSWTYRALETWEEEKVVCKIRDICPKEFIDSLY